MRRSRQRLVVVGQQRLAAHDAGTGQPLPRLQPRSHELRRVAVGRLDLQAVVAVAEQDRRALGDEDASRLLADPHQHPIGSRLAVSALAAAPT